MFWLAWQLLGVVLALAGVAVVVVIVSWVIVKAHEFNYTDDFFRLVLGIMGLIVVIVVFWLRWHR